MTTRAHRAAKRTGNLERVELDEGLIAVEEQASDLLALDAALDRLAALSPRQAQVVELRFFGGLSVEETARSLGVSDRQTRLGAGAGLAGERTPSMTPRCWERLGEILAEAVEYSGPERSEFLRHACKDDAQREQLFKLLAAHERPGAFVDRPILPAELVKEAADGRTFRVGHVVSGRFRVIRFAGEGGMGEVYAAEDQDLGTRVAIKTLHPHLAGSSLFVERLRSGAIEVGAIVPVKRLTANKVQVCFVHQSGWLQGVVLPPLAPHVRRPGGVTHRRWVSSNSA